MMFFMTEHLKKILKAAGVDSREGDAAYKELADNAMTIAKELIAAREKILKMKLASTPRLNHKGYSVCVVSSKEEISVVEQIIKELDSFEYDYLPDGWVSDLNRTVYHGKFDIDTRALVTKCYERGIDIDIVQTEEPW